MNFKKYDVIIVGSGISGLYAALNLSKSLRILLLSKNVVTLCNSALAQGGIAAVMDKDADSFALHIEDTLMAGGYSNNRENLKILVEQGPTDIENLLRYGVNFDRQDDGNVALTLEGGHSRNRIAHHKDSTGFEIVSALIECVKRLDNITMLENAHLLGLIKEGEDFLAEVYEDDLLSYTYYTTNTCILATGGIGRIYHFTTNSPIATGDGIYFAYNMGAAVKNLSLIQFHPTAFAPPDENEKRECFLISEAVRGEGAYLLNCRKERFMHKYEPERRELAPRDVVSRCILREQQETGSSEFWLDISHKDGAFLKKRFPMIYERVLQKGYDLTREPVPIYPCQHYLMGGIEVNGHGATSVGGLYAAGECAHTGVHGSNRLASNSLLEALVFSRLVAEDINARIKPAPDYADILVDEYPSPDGAPAPRGLRREIRWILQKAFFVVPDIIESEKGLQRVREIVKLLETGRFALTAEFIEIKAAATLASIILSEVLTKNSEKEGNL